MYIRLISLLVLLLLVPTIALGVGVCSSCVERGVNPGHPAYQPCDAGLVCAGEGTQESPGVCQYPQDSGRVAVCNPLGGQTLPDVVGTAADVIFNIALIAAPIVIVIAGFMLVTGGGDPAKVTRARNMIIWTVIGLIVIILSKSVVFVIQDIFKL